MRHPDDLTPCDLVKAPVILALLIVTSVLERFELMPRIRAAVRKTPDQLAAHVEAGEMKWPKADRVERRDDMSSTGKLTVLLQRDGDVVVNVSKGETVKEWESATVEFCAGGGGGGRSMRTREALIALMVAIEADNAATPIAADRMTAVPKEEAGEMEAAKGDRK